MLEVQKYLQNNSLEDLTKQYAIKVKRHSDYPNLIHLKYNQIDSKFSEKIVRECRSLILNENRNLEVVCMTYEKFGNHGEGYTATIDWDSAKVLSKADGCFPYNRKLNLWDGKTINIGKVVNKKLKPKLIGIDKNGNIIPCEILEHYKNSKKDNWLKITFDTPSRLSYPFYHMNYIIVTDNHHIMINDKFSPIGDAKIGENLTFIEQSVSDSVYHIIKSSLLGDGSISKDGKMYKYSESHKLEHIEYVNFIRKWLKNVSIKPDIRISGYGTEMHRVITRTFSCFDQLRSDFYKTGNKNGRKLPDDLSWIDDFTIAKWYMDDGSLRHTEFQKDRATISTDRFDKIDVERLASKLKEMYNVEVALQQSKKASDWFLRINAGKTNSIENFWLRIAPHIVPCMRYKLPESFRNIKYKEYPEGDVKYITKQYKIKKIEKFASNKKNFPNGRAGFDIKTTTGNYFINGILVHNSLSQLFYYDNKWLMATSGTPDGKGNVHDSDMSFKDLFWQVWNELGYSLPTDTELCFAFELITKHNRVIVPYTENRIILHGVRNRETLQELEPEPFAEFYKWKCIKSFPLKTIEQVIESANNIDPMKEEGYVVVDKFFSRVKIKSPSYIQLSHLTDGFGPRRMLSLIISGESSEWLAYFPQYKIEYEQLNDKFNSLVKKINDSYSTIAHIEKQKDFAQIVTRDFKDISGCLFAMRNRKVSAKEALCASTIKTLEALLDIKNEEN